jgi:hypothetical protein
MAVEAPRPLLGAGYYMKKLVAYPYLNNIKRKKLFYIQTLTKLPELTVVVPGNGKHTGRQTPRYQYGVPCPYLYHNPKKMFDEGRGDHIVLLTITL